MHTTETPTPTHDRFSGTALRQALGPGFQLHAATDAALHLVTDRSRGRRA